MRLAVQQFIFRDFNAKRRNNQVQMIMPKLELHIKLWQEVLITYDAFSLVQNILIFNRKNFRKIMHFCTIVSII